MVNVGLGYQNLPPFYPNLVLKKFPRRGEEIPYEKTLLNFRCITISLELKLFQQRLPELPA